MAKVYFIHANDKDPKCIPNIQCQNSPKLVNGHFLNRSNADRTAWNYMVISGKTLTEAMIFKKHKQFT